MPKNKTPEWPFDLDQVMRKGKIRTRKNGLILLADALTSLGHPTQYYHQAARWCAVEPCRPIEKREVKYIKEQLQGFLFSYDGHLLGRYLEKNHDELMVSFQKYITKDHDIENDAEAHWITQGSMVQKNVVSVALETFEEQQQYQYDVQQIAILLQQYPNPHKKIDPKASFTPFSKLPLVELKTAYPQRVAPYHQNAITFKHEHITHLAQRAVYEMKEMGENAKVVVETYLKFENHEAYQRLCVGILRENQEPFWINRDPWFDDAKKIYHEEPEGRYFPLTPEGQAWMDQFVLNLTTPSVERQHRKMRL